MHDAVEDGVDAEMTVRSSRWNSCSRDVLVHGSHRYQALLVFYRLEMGFLELCLEAVGTIGATFVALFGFNLKEIGEK